MSKQISELSDIHEITKKYVKAQVDADDQAVSQYVKNVCEQLLMAGEKIQDYVLVRQGDFESFAGRIQYSIERKEEVA